MSSGSEEERHAGNSLHRVTVTHAIPIEASTAVVADLFAVVSFDQLSQELKHDRPALLFQLPEWCPRLFARPFALIVLLYIVVQSLLALKGLTYGYNVEFCPKIIVQGNEISGCLKLTKPSP